MKTREIAAARVKAGYSQKRLAIEMGMTQTTYSTKERGIVRFTPDELVKLAELLGLTYQQVNDFYFDGRLPTG